MGSEATSSLIRSLTMIFGRNDAKISMNFIAKSGTESLQLSTTARSSHDA
jgi:hypothetical protein